MWIVPDERSEKKTALLSIESCLFDIIDRDPYVMV